MSQIPITREYATAVGEWCEKVENRSLLLNKFAFPKNWGDAVKVDQASNWSLMRIASNGSILLTQLANKLSNPGRKVQRAKANAMRAAAHVCRALSNISVGSGLETLRPKHTEDFLKLLRATYSAESLCIVKARLEGRLAINLAEGLGHGGINLDRIFGLPLINGSSVKGVARHAALDELKTKKNNALLETFVRVFGAAESDWKGKGDLASIKRPEHLPLDLKGAVTFLQATPTNDAGIVVDITNVHTPDYYRTGQVRKLANEHPELNYFPAVERDAEFAFPILLNGMSSDVNLLKAAERWLSIALAQRGLGAKTAAGYGWFAILPAEKHVSEQDEAEHPACKTT